MKLPAIKVTQTMAAVSAETDCGQLVPGEVALDYEASDTEETSFNREQDVTPEPENDNLSDSGGDQDGRPEAEDGEIDDLEDGEVKDEEDSSGGRPSPILPPPITFKSSPPPPSLPPIRIPPPQKNVGFPPPLPSPQGQINLPRPEDVGVCKWFIRGSCTWGDECKFIHPRGGPAPPPPDRMLMAQQPVGRPFQPRNDVVPVRGRGMSTGGGRPQMGRMCHFPPPNPQPTPPQLMEVPVAKPEAQIKPEDAWARGLEQAKRIIQQAVEKRANEPDFEKKRLTMPMSEDHRARHSPQSDTLSEPGTPIPPRPISRTSSTRASRTSRSRMGDSASPPLPPAQLPPPPTQYRQKERDRYNEYAPQRYPPQNNRYEGGADNRRQAPFYPRHPHQQHPNYHHRPPPPREQIRTAEEVLPPPPDKPNHNYPPPKIYKGTSAGLGWSHPMQQQNRGDVYRRNQPYHHQQGGHRMQDGRDRQQQYHQMDRGGRFPLNNGHPQQRRDYRNDVRRGGGDYGDRERDRGRPLPYDRPSYNREGSGYVDPWERRKGPRRREGSNVSTSSRSTFSSRSSRSGSRSRSRRLSSISSTSSSRSRSRSKSRRSISSGSSSTSARRIAKMERRKKQGSLDSMGRKRKAPVSAPKAEDLPAPKEKVSAKAAAKALGKKPRKELKKSKKDKVSVPVIPPSVQKTEEEEMEERKPIKLTIAASKLNSSGSVMENEAEEEALPPENAPSPAKKRKSKGPSESRETEYPPPSSPPPAKKAKPTEGSKTGGKETRRDELLKQLKSVEDAIAKKRSTKS